MRYRLQRGGPLHRAAAGAAIRVEAPPEPDSGSAPPPALPEPAPPTPPQEIEPPAREGLSGRQLRGARREAQRRGLAVTSDLDAVRQLRAQGVEIGARRGQTQPATQPAAPAGAPPLPEGPPDPVPVDGPPPGPGAPPEAPRAAPAGVLPGAAPNPVTAADVSTIQQELAQRRRRRSLMLAARLAVMVLLPTMVTGWYFFAVATPMYATTSEFVIQKAEASNAAAGLGGLFQGTSMATQQDSITVQSYLSSRAAMLRLDREEGFRAHFAQPFIDPLKRLPPQASDEETFARYRSSVRLSYDPTEGIVRMEVIAAEPEVSARFSGALIGYAEEQVDQLTQRLRADQMDGARASYREAEARRADALDEWLRIQGAVQQIDPVGETAARTQQIGALQTERQQLELRLQSRLSVAEPNAAQVGALRGRIDGITALIADLRREMTEETEAGVSLAQRNTELRLAEENYTFQTVMVQQALQQMESARTEANRQVRYLSVGVEPLPPDRPTYPRAAQNTALALAIFAGIYLMLSLTASILREQMSA
ncbi:capsule biosynthesis protein [Pseudoroseicyclus aestuarii]|nr:capsule biosynthesis protein [Pseudoroseicyclus aestuarii]